jgi:maltooligosyltrehalose trehalohydrolase
MSWRLERGAQLGPEGTVTFSVWAPRADRVSVRLLDSDGKTRAELPMQPGELGGFTARTDLGQAPVGSDYVFVLPQAGARPDPVSRRQVAGVHGPSRIVDPTSFRWTDERWKGLPLEDLLFYELHVGTFTAAGTFSGVEERLSYLRDLGVTAVELMPVNTFPGARNWGYDGALLFAPHEAYGGPDGLRHLVDACHARGLALFLDVVYNHLGPEGNYLGDFGPYFTDRYRTPWGSALNFDGPESDQVRRFFIDNALHWLTEYHVDGLRLDAIHGIFDLGARHVLHELADEFHAQAARLGRRAWLVAESDLNDPRVIRPAETGGHGLDAQWSDDFHHAVHTLVTGNRRGYFVDFGRASDVAKAVTDGFVYDGRYSPHRQRRHGASSASDAASRFVIFNQNHDQIANACQGRRLAQLVGPERQKLAAVVLFSTPGLPLLFQGEELAADEPWEYFTSHTDPKLAEAVREGRHREYLHLQEEGASVASWADPQDPQTFARVKLRWAQLDEPAHADMLAFYRSLIGLRNRLAPLRNGRKDLTRATADDAARLVTIRRDDPGGAATFTVANFADGPAWVRLPEGGRWQLVLATQMVAAPSDPLASGAETAVPGSTAYVFERV